ncbi:hypothetical protein E3N88_28126 [Mikania micrantha]|uniref:Uncharacterized protein n=1 Tax=Mikania micrantha TaxID=192012 RepID=A0A5N6N1H0_9ASTR|nr:hypothetical protein E3N88_28126 [Mikania micrantha]
MNNLVIMAKYIFGAHLHGIFDKSVVIETDFEALNHTPPDKNMTLFEDRNEVELVVEVVVGGNAIVGVANVEEGYKDEKEEAGDLNKET